MTTLQERRHAGIVAQLAKEGERRDDLIAKLIRCDGKLRRLKRQLARSEKRLAGPPPVKQPESIDIADLAESNHPIAKANAESWQAVTGKPKPGPIKPAITDAGIPDFLRRAKASEQKDKETAAAIIAEKAERKKERAALQAETRKARQRGDLKRMPLTGREALNYLRTGNRT